MSEVERLTGVYQQRGVDVLIADAADTITKLRTEVERLREIIDQYCAHDSTCPGAPWSSSGGECTCGLRAALAAGEPAEEES